MSRTSDRDGIHERPSPGPPKTLASRAHGAALQACVAGGLLAAVGCGSGAPDPSPQAVECGALVAHYVGSPRPVAILGFEHDADSPRVRIDYRWMDGMNVPVQGSALCRFKLRLNGAVLVTDAIVDENRVPEDDVEAFGKRRRAAAPTAR